MVEVLFEQLQASWLTPTYLFLLLNLVIGTILISSAFTNHHNQPSSDDDEDNCPTSEPVLAAAATAPPPSPNPPQLARAPSLFSRVTSFNLSNYYPEENHHPQLEHTQSSPSLFSRVTSFKLTGRTNEPDPEEYDRPVSTQSRLETTQSCPVTPTAPAAGVKRTMTRAPSFLSRVASFPLGMRNSNIEVCEVNAHNKNDSSNVGGKTAEKVKKSKKKETEKEMKTIKRNEAEVDAKADAFINKFKQQLKLQRIDSLMRYRTSTTTT